MAFPRVLLVTGSAGHGHVRASQAVAAALRQRHAALDVAELDALDRMPRWYARTYRRGYVRMVDRHPLVWRWFYESNEEHPSALGHWITVAASQRLLRDALAWKPDLVLCTHFLAPEVFAWAVRRGRASVPIHVVVTDHDCHRIWWQPEVEAFYVPTDLVRARLAYRHGVPLARIHVTGIPIDASFRGKRDVVAVRAAFGLDPGRPTVLLLSGGFAPGPMAASILGIWSDRPDVQVLAVAGRNERLRRRLAALPRPEGAVLHVLGFRDDVPDLMAASDLVVSKSGGLTTSECMAMGKPLVVSAFIAGQEERNADAVVSAGAGIKAPTPEEVRWHVVRLVTRADELKAMAARARAFARPAAADDIADLVAQRIGLTPVSPPPAHGARAVRPSAV